MVQLGLQTIFMVNSMDLVHADLVCQIHRQVVDHLVMVYEDNPLVDLVLQDHQDHLYRQQDHLSHLSVPMALLAV